MARRRRVQKPSLDSCVSPTTTNPQKLLSRSSCDPASRLLLCLRHSPLITLPLASCAAVCRVLRHFLSPGEKSTTLGLRLRLESSSLIICGPEFVSVCRKGCSHHMRLQTTRLLRDALFSIPSFSLSPAFSPPDHHDDETAVPSVLPVAGAAVPSLPPAD